MIDKGTFDTGINFHGAKGLVFLGNKILVFRRDAKTTNLPLQVDLPGGGKEGDESPFECFKREVMEEFGLSIQKEDIVYSKIYPSTMDPSKVAYFFVTRPLNYSEKDIVFGDEGLEFILMTPQEFAALTDGVKRQQERTLEYLASKKA